MSDTLWIDRTEYPFASHFLEVPAGRLHYVDEGAGHPIVMLHGNPTWSFLYRDLIKRLAGRYRCIVPDHIGFGLSAKPADWRHRPEDHADNLCRLLAHLGLGRVTLVMQDWGGPIGLSYAVARPGHVDRLILMNTWAWPVDDDFRFRTFSRLMGGTLGQTLIRRYNFFARTLLPRAFGDKSRLSEAAYRHYLRPLQAQEDRRGCMVLPAQIVNATPWLARLWDNISVLRDTPVLLVWGMRDIAFRNRELKRWERAFPRARSVRLNGVGHFVPEEAPRELAAAVDTFLAETGQSH